MSALAERDEFVGGMTIAAALRRHPNSRWVLLAYHLGKCFHCPTAEEETLAQVSREHQFPVERLLADLNSLLAPAGE